MIVFPEVKSELPTENGKEFDIILNEKKISLITVNLNKELRCC
jgi:hypothetical protein